MSPFHNFQIAHTESRDVICDIWLRFSSAKNVGLSRDPSAAGDAAGIYESV